LETLQARESDSSSIAINSVAAPHKILIFEDLPSVRSMLSHMFTSEGFKTICASDGQEGFELAVREPRPRYVKGEWHAVDRVITTNTPAPLNTGGRPHGQRRWQSEAGD
jgi:hypothetical protein